jgi:hypothetical protein
VGCCSCPTVRAWAWLALAGLSLLSGRSLPAVPGDNCQLVGSRWLETLPPNWFDNCGCSACLCRREECVTSQTSLGSASHATPMSHLHEARQETTSSERPVANGSVRSSSELLLGHFDLSMRPIFFARPSLADFARPA